MKSAHLPLHSINKAALLVWLLSLLVSALSLPLKVSLWQVAHVDLESEWLY